MLWHKRFGMIFHFLVLLTAVSNMCQTSTYSAISPPLANTDVLAFVSNRDGNNEIYTMNANGSNIRRLTYNDRDDLYPDWSPDGNKIAFSSNREQIVSDIYIMNADGSDVFNITNNSVNPDRYPSWSPDGTRIAFSRMIGGSSDIYVINIDGSDLFKVVDGGEETYNLMPTWSPDGSQIMFTTANDLPRVGFESSIIQSVNIDGTNLTRIGVGGLNTDGNLDWSWANNTIAYYDSYVTQLVIYTTDVDASFSQPITAISEGENQSHKNPSWSPDGSRIAFESRTWNQPDYDTNIFVIDLASGEITNITATSMADDMMPDWRTYIGNTP